MSKGVHFNLVPSVNSCYSEASTQQSFSLRKTSVKMEQIKKKMAQLKRTQEEAEERAKKAEDELAETNAKAQAVSWS